MPWKKLLDRNRDWVDRMQEGDPGYFTRLAADHSPMAMFIGCSDARVPADTVTGSDHGELFVHRNIANLVVLSDSSLSASLQYAVEVLGVRDIVVCGHHGCGGCRGALAAEPPPLVEAWISPLRLLARIHEAELSALPEDRRVDRLAELNVVEQIHTLTRHPSIKAGLAAGRDLRLHGVVFEITTGLLRPHVEVDADGIHLVDGPRIVREALVG